MQIKKIEQEIKKYRNMKDLEEYETYYLGDLNEAECNEILKWLKKNDNNWDGAELSWF